MDSRDLSLVLIKPDAVRRGIIGRIIQRIEDKNLQIIKMEMLTPSVDQCKEHYAEHSDKDFYIPLVEFISSGAVVAMIVYGENALEVMRAMAGSYKNPQPGTIRGDFATTIRRNCIHTTASPERVFDEIDIWFKNYF